MSTDDLHDDESAGTFSEELTNRGRSQTRSVLWTNEGENVPVNGHLSLLIKEIAWRIDCTCATGMRGLDRLTQICHGFEKPRAAVVLVAGLTAVLLGTACNGGSPTSPTTTTTTTTTPPTTTETFEGTVTAGGSTFYSFSIEQSGTVNITLLSVSGTYVPSTVWLGLGIGQPEGTDCITTSTVNTAAGAIAQLTGTYGPGVFCARVSDIGNLFGTAAFSASIEHP